MEIKGTIIALMPVTEGEKNGKNWIRGGFVIETAPDDWDNTRKIAFDTMRKEIIDTANNLMGMAVTVNFFPESKEYNDRWYTSLRCTKLNAMQNPAYNGGFPANPAPAPQQQPQAQQETPYIQGAFDDDPDLPF